MEKIFISFTIKGDHLNLNEIIRDISAPASTYEKGEVSKNKFNSKEYKQKTNRWVYSIESQGAEKINSVISRMYKELCGEIDQISKYTNQFSSLMDIVIYVNSEKTINQYNISLSKRSLNILNKLNAKFSLTVFDW